MFFVDSNMKGWAFRFLREAMACLVAIEGMPELDLAIEVALSAMRKAQMAIYYCLGDPFYLGPRVYKAVMTNEEVRGDLPEALLRLERAIQLFSSAKFSSKEEVKEKAKAFLDIASDIVEAIIGEKLEI